ncbi:MAG: polysaccharide deacetylase family protein [Caldilineaceae bacterium]
MAASTSTPPSAVSLILTTTPTVTPAHALMVSDQATPHRLVLVATPTRRYILDVASPLATPAPTLSLLDLLTKTVVVTVTMPVSTAPSPTHPLTVPLTSTVLTTVTIPYPAPPITVHPVLGPQPIVTATLPLPVATLTDLQPDGIARTVQVPILMYHYLSTPPVDADIYRRDLSVPPALFAAHLDRMQAEGYSTISLYALVAHIQQGAPLPEKPVVITFDDGYRDNYENAFPLLHERQMTATFFIVTDFIDRERPEYLTWDMVREMYAGGMSIEAHGVDHTTLRGRSQADLEFQALRSYETIQDRIGVRPRFLSYPAGEYDDATIAIFRSANYWAGFTTVQGATHSNEKLFELHRIRMRNSTTPDELIRLLQIDW